VRTGRNGAARNFAAALLLSAACGEDGAQGPEIHAEFADLSAAVQVDRVGRPNISTSIIPHDRKDAYNQATDPAQDYDEFIDDVIQALSGPDPAVEICTTNAECGSGYVCDPVAGCWSPDSYYGGTAVSDNQAELLANLAFPDVLAIDITQDSAYVVGSPGGRAPGDDVITQLLEQISSFLVIDPPDDGVGENDATHPGEFPYFAAPH